eukprot:CAMPEP_0174703950 /NCGR_PEP_ID=MMETSP1094-20130205/7719_1 /TAXON_ID=156173 /ORGANISM="Chrysochromulina brevifilum, Strain UTEX LB 985" /LENGTH=31 /DNA_ID= /DNA_START= /DNA_END= /DNA_ORIENTATION=
MTSRHAKAHAPHDQHMLGAQAADSTSTSGLE